MDDPDSIKIFEETLKNNARKQPIPLYCDRNINKLQLNNLSSQNVINNVKTQLRAFQKADVMSYSKERGKKLVINKKSSFVPVNLLQQDEKVHQPKNTNKFETQFVLDTQIIDFIENGEPLIDTQEFNCTFHHTEDAKIDLKEASSKKNIDSQLNLLDAVNCEKVEMPKHVNKITATADIKVANVEDVKLNENSDIFSDCIDVNVNDDSEYLDGIVTIAEDVKLRENSDIFSDYIDVNDNSDDDVDIPASYVFQPIIKSKTPSPLVFDLKKFEDFEKIALPVIDEHTNFESAKHLINSQILGRELVFETNNMPLFTSTSPVLDINKQLVASKSDINENINNNTNCKDSVILKDEILFSSDEETEYCCKDLPLTCALETSFYDHSKVLDKTMYVGFQTANDKSIQISIESFSKAKSLLSDVDKKDPPEVSLSELVDKCDSIIKRRTSLSPYKVDSVSECNLTNCKSFEMEENISKALNYSETVMNICNHNEDLNENGNDDKKKSGITNDTQCSKEPEDIFKIPVAPLKRNFDGFMTASNKKIKLTAQALGRSKAVFQDIDLENNFDSVIENNKDSESIVTVKASEITAVDHLISEDILQEFDQEMQQLEYERQKGTKEFVGFKTASNKDIDVSQTALLKTKKIFDDIFLSEDSCENYNENFYTGIQNSTDRKSLTNKEDDNCSALPFIGFKTASNKSIKISEEALMKSKNILENFESASDNQNCIDPSISKLTCATINKNNIFQDVDGISEGRKDEDPIINKETFIGFRTANNKGIKISEEAYTKTKNMFNNITSDVDNNEQAIEDNSATVAHTDLELEEINKLRNEICHEDFNTEFNIALVDVEDSTRKFCGFKTASNKAVIISEKAMTESKKMFADLDLNDENNERSEKIILNDEETKSDFNSNTQNNIMCYNYDTTSTNQGPLIGFKTASNKEVKISEEAIAKSRNLFIDLIQANDTVLTNNSETEASDPNYMDKNDMDKINKKDLPTFALFQTASQKPVVISDEAIVQTRNLFKSTDNDNLGVCFKGFKTANKKPIQISAPALSNNKALIKDIEDKTDENNYGDFNPIAKEKIVFKGFQTASKKPVIISDEALAKSKSVFKDINDENMLFLEDLKLEGLQKASNKTASSTIEENDLDKINKKDVPSFTFFQTASQKPVVISDEAIVQTKDLFKSFDNNAFGVTNKQVSFKGFQTANKKPIQISTQALAKSKELFKDIEDETVDNDFDGFNPKVNEKLAFKGLQIEEYNKEIINKKNVPTFTLFQTSSQKPVLISIDDVKNYRDIESLGISKNMNTTNKENINQYVSKTTFSFKTANNNEIEITDGALERSRKSLCDKLTMKSEVNEGKFLDTQVINNFETSLHTEDFCKETPDRSKRSGSPILSCPKAKKRKKFETPYRSQTLLKPGNKLVKTSKLDPESDIKSIFTENYKKYKRFNLKDLAEVEKKEPKNAVNVLFTQFSFDTLLEYEFTGSQNDVNDTSMSVGDVQELFLSGINKKFIPDGWLNNHLRLIIWKLISYEIRFASTLFGVCSVRNVLDQLKYRYDKELYNAERPLLRKILEKDDVPSKTMVLCVAGLYVDGSSVSSVSNISSNVELLLSDGWYCVKANIDKMLTKLVYDEKIKVGCKLITNGAELLNCDQGASPWEDTSSVRLKIFGNSTRLARWDTRLGCYGTGAILTQLSTVQPEGGKVSKLRLYLCRVYPLLFIEKFEDGSTVTRSERLENMHQAKYESDRQLAMEKLCEEVEKEVADQDSQDSESKRIYDDESQCIGPRITESQVKSLVERTNRRRERVIQNIHNRIQEKMEKSGLNVTRNVVPLLKVRVAGVEEKGGSVKVTKGLMSIWKPSDSITELIKEGAWLEVMNVVPTAVRYSEIHISAGRSSVFHQSKHKRSENMLPYTKSLNRQCYYIKDLVKNPTAPTDYNEIDTVGFVVQIDPSNSNFEISKPPFQNVYFSDVDKNIICVNFWGGLKKFGYQNFLDTGQVYACVNLQKRAGNTKKSIPHYRVTEFSYFTKSPKIVMLRNLVDELVKKFSGVDKRKFCDDCLVLKNNYSKIYSNNDVSPYRFNNDHNLTKNKIFIDSPLYKKPVDDLNLTGLDFESTFKQDTETSPSLLLRKKKVNERIARLKMYGEPPPLSPMHIINKSKSALNEYKSPLVASAKNIPQNSSKNIQMSPVISLNRTYVKSMNPVKLNFSNVQDNSDDNLIDHFAEEFDASPPLSLD